MASISHLLIITSLVLESLGFVHQTESRLLPNFTYVVNSIVTIVIGCFLGTLFAKVLIQTLLTTKRLKYAMTMTSHSAAVTVVLGEQIVKVDL